MAQYERDWVERAHQYAVRIVRIAGELPRTPAGFEIAHQVVRSGPSIVFNLEEAQAAMTLPDTLNKTANSRKEACETRRALLVIRDAELLQPRWQPELGSLIQEGSEWVSMLTAGCKRLQERVDREKEKRRRRPRDTGA